MAGGRDDRTLLIDLGNSNLKWCWLGEDSDAIRIVPHQGVPAPTLAARQWGDVAPPGRVLLASVAAPDWCRALEAWIGGAWGLVPERPVARQALLGVTNGYSTPERLGVDRWLTLLAVHRQGLSPACIVDSGTATTLDVIDGDGNHLGGLIVPGLEVMNEALLQRTYIPRLRGDGGHGTLGRDTPDGVALGALLATAGMVEKVMLGIEREQGVTLSLVLTGSAAAALAPRLERSCLMRPGLVLSGLALVAGGAP